MNSIQQQAARTGAVERAGASATTRGLRKALMALAVAVAALASAVVLVLMPQPIPFPSRVPLACSGSETHQSPQVATVRQMSRVSAGTDGMPASRWA